MCYEMGKGGNSTMSLIFKDHSLKEIFNDVISETNHKQHKKMIYRDILLLNNCDFCLHCGKSPHIGNDGLIISLIKHHVSYFPEKIAYVHNECHSKIHDSKNPITHLIQFEDGDSRKFYAQQKMEEMN